MGRAKSLAEPAAERTAKERKAEQPKKQIVAPAADERPNDEPVDDDVYMQEGDVVFCCECVLGKAEIVKQASRDAYPTSTTPINTKAAFNECRFF